MPTRALTGLILLAALGGGAFAWMRGQAIRRAQAPPPALATSEVEAHKVTPAMLEGAGARAKRPAPAFRRDDAEGSTQDLAELVKAGPLVVIFIKDGCPCSASAEAYFNAIHAAYRGRIPFLGVIDGDAAVARRWASAHGVPFPILPDPELTLAKGYGATNSAYVALIDRGGQIAEFWPGYSAGMLGDLSRRAARLAGLPEESIGTGDAPDELYSGCPF